MTKLRRAFQLHRLNAKRRGIGFLFTFEQWVAWWMTDDRWSNRGRRKGQFVMARRYDTGPYSLDNVYCTTQRGNYFAVPHEKRCAAARKSWDNHPDRECYLKGRRGAQHPKSRPVRTQVGIFGSAALAADAFEISRQEAARMARLGLEGWGYIDDPGAIP